MADNKQMKTLGGYEIVDEKAREEINVVGEKADEALSLAKGATKAFVYDTYSDMIAELNALDKAELLVNFHVMIRTVCVPDLWISGVSDEHVEYTYTSNEDFIADLTEDGIVQVGYFVLSALETQKVDLSEYVKKDDYATNDGAKAGVSKILASYGMGITGDGFLYPLMATNNEIDQKKQWCYSSITPHNLDYAVMKALSDSKLEWTEEQKQLARALLGSVGTSDVATSYTLGLIKVSKSYGFVLTSEGCLSTDTAHDSEINSKSGNTILRVGQIDKIVKSGLVHSLLDWTEEEKAKARKTLGAIGGITPQDNKILAFDANSNLTLLNYSTYPTSYTIPFFTTNGALNVGTPTEDANATTKKYVDDNFIGKAQPTQRNYGDGVLIGFDTNGNLVYQNVFGSYVDKYTIPIRDGDGIVYGNEPTTEKGLANKKYVDDLITELRAEIEALKG